MNVFFVNEFEVGVNDSVFSGSEQQKVEFTCRRLQTGNRKFVAIKYFGQRML